MRLRRAAYAVDLEQIMIAGFGRKEFFRLGPEMAAPETPWYSDVGREVYQYDPDKAKHLMRQAGYNGEQIRWLSTKEYFYMYNMGLSFKDQLSKVGFKIDQQVMDWATLVSTRSKPDQQEVFITGHPTWVHPILQVYLDGTWPGWWNAEQKNRLVAQMLAESDQEKQKALAVRELQQFHGKICPGFAAENIFSCGPFVRRLLVSRTRLTGISGTVGLLPSVVPAFSLLCLYGGGYKKASARLTPCLPILFAGCYLPFL